MLLHRGETGGRSVTAGTDAAFGERLRRLREAAGLTQEELAQRSRLTPDAIGVLERGQRRRPYPATVRALADALGLPAGERAALLASVPRRGAAAPPATARRPPPAAVPEPPTPLVGRERESGEVGALLRGGARLVTLTGPGGVGKTRLALHVAGGVRDRFPDGIAFVPLAAVDDPALVVPTVASALGLAEVGGQRRRRRSGPASGRARRCWSWTTSSRCWRPRPRWRPCSPPARGWRCSPRAARPSGRGGSGSTPWGRWGCPTCAASRPPRTRPAPPPCGSSSSGRGTWPPASRSPGRTRPRWRRSAGGSTACRWRSSWPRRGCGCSPPPSCWRAWTGPSPS